MGEVLLAHGVGRVYESPIPLGYYLAGAAATVIVSFIIRALSRGDRPLRPTRKVAGERVAVALSSVLRWTALLLFALGFAAGIIVGEVGFTFTTLAFWLVLIVGTTVMSSIIGGAWDAADPWATIDRLYRIHPVERSTVELPWWTGPLLLFALFWFELVSGVGFEDRWIVLVVLGYSLFALSMRPKLGYGWEHIDPLTIIFGFASRIAPLRLTSDGIYRKSLLSDLDPGVPMPKALFGSLFVLLASTTLDNVVETVGWSDLLRTLQIDEISNIVVDTFALAFFVLPFLASFVGAVAIAHRWIGRDRSLGELARIFGWSLLPIGIAYVLAHNAPLVITGMPGFLRALSDPFQQGWNLLGTADLWETFIPSPRFVWFLEIAVIVGGHILGVLAARRAAVRLSSNHPDAVKSQYALTALMSVYTIATLWLLGQPLVA